MSITAAQSNNLIATASHASGASASAAAASASGASNTLAGNFNTFLTLLTTQMKNQDPTSPLDTNQFTSQLVQFAGVEQQINMNTSLGTLINVSKASSLYQASAMIGHQVAAQSDQLALQGGQAGLQFSVSAPQKVTVAFSNSSGVEVYRQTVDAQAGTNGFGWQGQMTDGRTAPDGVYNVSVTAGTTTTPIPFNVLGIATGVDGSGATPTVTLGNLSIPIASVRSIM